MYLPSGVKTRDGKDIMCYTFVFYIKNKAQIDKLVKKCRLKDGIQSIKL